jgi:hypothetical protein
MLHRSGTWLLISGAILMLVAFAIWLGFATGYMNWPIWQA